MKVKIKAFLETNRERCRKARNHSAKCNFLVGQSKEIPGESQSPGGGYSAGCGRGRIGLSIEASRSHQMRQLTANWCLGKRTIVAAEGHACILAYDTHLHLFLPLEVGT